MFVQCTASAFPFARMCVTPFLSVSIAFYGEGGGERAKQWRVPFLVSWFLAVAAWIFAFHRGIAFLPTNYLTVGIPLILHRSTLG